MKWKKLGNVFRPMGDINWMRSHAAVPIAEHLGGDLFRIIFSTRDSLQRSYSGFLIIDISKPNEILDISKSPILSPGNLGEFDDSGAMATWLVKSADSQLLYYIGWNLGVTVPFRNSIGLALSTDSVSYTRYANGPIVDRSMSEPHFCASCCVIPGEDFWRMWYVSCTHWTEVRGEPQHHYHIKYAESNDGIHWRRDGTVAINYASESEYAISRPSVIRDRDGWKMWYSFRGAAYRIGYAESEDGRNWVRRDSLSGIDVSSSDWDSEMIEYPFVFDHQGQRFMLYNGNNFGSAGFGLAVLESS